MGVFHNDLVAVSNENVLLYHEQAFLNGDRVIEEIMRKYQEVSNQDVHMIKIGNDQLKIKEAVETYFFNSQIVTLADGSMTLILPRECVSLRTKNLIQWLMREENPITNFHFVDLNESMHNGGGPACLRLRVVLNEREARGVHQGCIIKDDLIQSLESWINKNYRDVLSMDDLRDPQLIIESRKALDQLTQILHLGSIYPFQKNS